MRQSFSVEGKSRPELIQLISELSSRVYRLEREKSLLRRTLETIRQGVVSDFPSFQKRARKMINEVLLKTDARRKRKT